VSDLIFHVPTSSPAVAAFVVAMGRCTTLVFG
jgi:hypothetical protein